MRRSEKTSDQGTQTDDNDEEVTESEQSVARSKEIQLFGLPLHNFSYKQLPRKVLKYSFLVINSAIFLAGITAVIISMWMLTDSKLTLRLTGQKLFITILLIIGLISLAISIEGIIALRKKKRQLLAIYIGFHSILLFGIFVCSIMSSSFFERVSNKIGEDMRSTIVKYRMLDWVTEAWDNTQEYLQCCGIKSYKDWERYLMEIPQSCCAKTIDQCLEMNEDVTFKSGCLKNTIAMLKSNIDTVTVAVLFISLVSGMSLYLGLGVNARLAAVQYIDD